MDEEALNYVYDDFVKGGYDGSVEDFTTLLSNDNEALTYVFDDFVQGGYDGSVEDFSILIGISKPKKKEKDSQSKIDTRINNVNKVYSEQVDKINSGQWDDDQKVELKKRVAAKRDEQIEKLNKEKDIDVYSERLIEISSMVPENIEELSINVKEEDYNNYLKYAEDLLKSIDPNLEYTEEDISNKAKELYAISKFRKEETNKALEDFETEFGINRTESFSDVLDIAMDYGKYLVGSGDAAIEDFGSNIFDIAKGLYNDYTTGKLDNIGDEFEKDKWGLVTELNSRYLGTEKEKEYKKNREELHRQLVVKNKKLDTEYRDKVAELTILKSKADKDYNEFEKLEKRLKQQDSTITSDDYNRYMFLFNKIKNDQTQFNAKLEELNNSTIPSNDFETIKNLTLKTYDNLERLENIVGSSVAQFGGAVATLGRELSLPELIKWTGVDIETDEGLNNIFGEDTEGVMGVVKDAVKAYGATNKFGGELIQEAYNLSDHVRDLNSPSMEWKDIKNEEDFVYWAGDMFAGQVLNTALVIAVPPAGLALLSAQAAGDKMNDMNIEMEGVKGEDGEWLIEPQEYNAAQYFGSAALYGGIEYATERVSFGLLKGMLGNVSKAFKLTGRSALPSANITLKNLSNGQAWANFGSELVKGGAKEGAAEGIVTIVNNLTDQYVLGDETANWADNISESFVSGLLMGKAYGAPNIIVPVLHSFSSEGELAKANKRNAELLKLSESRNQVLNNGGDATQIQNRITEILDEQMLAMEGVRLRGIEMSPEDRQYIIDSSNDQHQLRAEIDKINNNKDIDEESKEMLINGYAQKIQEIESERERIFSSYAPEARAKQATEKAKKLVESADLDVDIVSAKDEAEFATELKKGLREDTEITDEDIKKMSSQNFGIYIGEVNENTGRRKIVLNEAEIAKFDKWTTAQHEVLHAVLDDVLKFDRGGTNRVALGNAIKEKLQEIDPKTLGDSDFAQYYLEYLKDPEDVKGEELVTLLSEAITTGDIKFNESFFTKIGDLIRRLFQNISPGLAKVKFDSAKDVYNFIKDYNTSLQKGKFTRAQKTAIEKGVVPKIEGKMAADKPFLDVEFTDDKGRPVVGKLSKKLSTEQTKGVEQSILELKQEIKENEEVAKRFGKEPVPTAKQQRLEQSILKEQLKPTIDSFVESQTKRLFDPIAPDARNNVTRQTFKESMVSDIEAMILNEFEQKQDIEKFITSRGYLRANSLAKRLGIKSVEQGITKDIDEAKGVAAETETVTVEEKTPTKQIKLKERLGDDAVKITEEVKKRGKDIDLETIDFKTLKDLTPEMTQEMFGIVPKTGNLTKADVRNAQQFISKNADVLIAMLPEGSTPSGTSTGVQKVLLDAFYTKGDRAAMAKTGSKAGLKEQTKRDDITKEEFNELFGITPAGQPNLSDRNTSSRIKALVTQTGRMLTNQAIREQAETKGEKVPSKVFEGKSKLMFSRIPLNKIYNRSNDSDFSTYNIPWRFLISNALKNTNVDLIKMNTEEGRKRFLDYAVESKLIEKLPKSFWLSMQGTTIGIDKLVDPKDKVSKELIKELKAEGYKTVEIDPTRGHTGNLPFKNKGEAQKWIDSVEKEGGRFAKESEVFKDMIKKEDPRSSKLPLYKALNDQAFIKRQQNSLKGLQQVFEIFQSTMKNPEGIAFVGAVLSSISYSQNHFIRKAAPWKFYEKGFMTEPYRQEHTLPASILGKYLFGQAYSGTVKENFDLIKNNYFQGALLVTSDNKLKGEDFSYVEQTPEGWNLSDNIWERYFNEKVETNDGGIDPNNLILTNNQSVAESFNVAVDKVKVTPDIKQEQVQLISDQLQNKLSKNIANKTINLSIPLLQDKTKSAEKNVTNLKKSKVIKTSDQAPNSEDIRQAEILDKALNIARDPNAPVKKIRVFDFDDTLARTKSGVKYTMRNETGKPQPGRKAILLVGSAGAGKSTIVNKLGLRKQGYKYVNQDVALDWLAKNAGLPKDMNEFTDAEIEKWRDLQSEAGEAAKTKATRLQGEGSGVIIDATGSSSVGFENTARELADAGYDAHIVFVDSSLDTALKRNRARGERRLTDTTVKNSYEAVQKNKKEFSEYTGRMVMGKPLAKEFTEINTDNLKQGDPLPAEFISKINDFTSGYVKGRLTAEEFAKRGTELLEQGAEFDFSEFNKVKEGKKGPLFNVAKAIQDARGTKDVFVLTARAAEAAPAIKEFLDSQGLNIPLKNITGLGDSSPLAKSGWVVDKAAEGYNDFYFADDHMANVKAVKRVLDVIDVKSKVQQAKVKFSKNVDKMMNNIIYEKTGIEQYKEFSEIAAQARGRKKKSFDLIPPSAQDFGGLLYKLLAKGETGNTQWEWMQEHLIKPYGRAMNDLSVAQNQLMADFRALKESLVGIPKNLKKEAIKGFTNEDIVRVATWDRQGIEVDGISKRDLDAIRKYIEGKPDLNIFIDQLVAITKGDGYYYPGKNWLAGTITTDFREGLRQVTRKNLLQQWQENVDLAFNESNMNKIEAAFGPKYREALENSLQRMSTGQNRRQGMSRVEQRFLDYINNSVGAVMFLNARSAVLQTISAVNFINWKDNNPAKAAAAFANQPQYWKDFMTLMNSDFLVDRRNGLKINVSESEIAEAAKTSKNTVKGVISYLLNKGFVFTQIADSFAIASGGATLYRNRIKTYMKEGMSEAEATEKAFLDFRELAEESQQSARADKISQQQASTLGRLVLAFANTPSQYARIMDKAGKDLIAGRGDWKANMSKIAYYGFVQNLLFTALQSALFALAAGDDDDEEAKIPEEKVISTANSMADNILKGIGVHGVIISAAKNTIMDLIQRSQKDPYFNPDAPSFPGPEYTDAISKLIAISPPLSIKLRKIKGGITDWYFNRWRPEAGEPFNINNPSYRAASKVIAGVTNIPLDRLFQKIENIQGAMDDVNPTWQRIFMALGWPKWQLETPKEKEKRKAKEKEERRNIRAEEKPSIYTKDEQINILKQYGLTDNEIKELKNEELRVKKIEALRKKTNKIYTPKPTSKTSKSYKPSSKTDDNWRVVKSTSKQKSKRNKILAADRTKRQVRLYKLKKSDQLDTLKSLGLSDKMLEALKYEEDRVRKIEELYDKNK